VGIAENSWTTGTRALNVFLSSPFSEPVGEKWALRETLRERLRRKGHRPWLYEVDAKKYRRTNLGPREIIIEEIARCDVVITLYKSRAGSFLNGEPFYATAFETFHARRLGKTVYLHILDGSERPRLRGVLSVFEPILPLPSNVVRHGSENELVEAVISELAQFPANGLIQVPTLLLAEGGVQERLHSLEWLDRVQSGLLSAHDLWQAAQVACQVPLFRGNLSLSLEFKFRYAQILSSCAGIWANQARYDRAIECAWTAVRMFMESGNSYEMISEIQAVSGILNMANQIKRAYWVNTFGLQSAAKLQAKQRTSLWPAFNDSRGSIMTRLGKLSNARERIRRSLPTSGDASPYTLAKYATALSRLGGKANIDSALKLMHDIALPLAEQQVQSIGYVKREAARLAAVVGDTSTALRLLSEAEGFCQRNGLMHTLNSVERMKAEAALRCSLGPF
jgi:Domain of unknown function (DUF4062)